MITLSYYLIFMPLLFASLTYYANTLLCENATKIIFAIGKLFFKTPDYPRNRRRH
ncbi:MAG: hypothetical protein HW390_2462 [Candidatus Brocadiaceae bacterium]|nr:hypothetical protein [Candidatus Brocadiaceae bacterium]